MAYAAASRAWVNGDIYNTVFHGYQHITGPYDDFRQVVNALKLDTQDKGQHQTEAVILVVFVFILILALAFLIEERVINIVLEDLRNPIFIMGTVGVAIFMLFVFTRSRGNTPEEIRESIRLETAAKHGFIGLIIAYFAHLDTYFLTFILVFIFVYYLTGWI